MVNIFSFFFYFLYFSFPFHFSFQFSIFRWIGEKYDGIRSVWNPNKHQLYLFKIFIYKSISFIFLRYTRHGRPLPLNDSISNSFPSSFLDGELWYVSLLLFLFGYFLNFIFRFGRGMFSYVIKLLTESPELIYLSFMR